MSRAFAAWMDRQERITAGRVDPPRGYDPGRDGGSLPAHPVSQRDHAAFVRADPAHATNTADVPVQRVSEVGPLGCRRVEIVRRVSSARDERPG